MMFISRILRSVRWLNLLLVGLLYVLLRHKFPELDHCNGFDWLIGATLWIAAAANLENDLMDIHTDRHNRKFNLYHHHESIWVRALPYVFYAAGLATAWIFLHQAGFSGYWLLYFVAVELLLTIYNRATKKTVLIGNVTVSVLVMLLILQLFIFCRFPVSVQKPLLLLAFWAFFANLNRELAKDFQDRKGDRLMRYQTLPIISPRKAIRLILLNLLVLWVVFFTFLRTPHLHEIAKIYFAVLLVYASWATVRHTSRTMDFKQLAVDYKILLALGLAGVLLL